MFEPVVFATVPITRDPTTRICRTLPDMAVMEGIGCGSRLARHAIVIVDSQTGHMRSVPVDVMPFLPVGGPGDVLYGIDSTTRARRISLRRHRSQWCARRRGGRVDIDRDGATTSRPLTASSVMAPPASSIVLATSASK